MKLNSKSNDTGAIVQFLPSYFWIFFYVLPFLFTKKYFPSQSNLLQITSMSIFTIAILLGDSIIFSKVRKRISSFGLRLKINQNSMLAVIILIAVVHYSIFGFPLLHIHEPLHNLALIRNAYDKSTGTLQLFFYLSNAILNFIGLSYILNQTEKKHYIKAMFGFIWLSIYAISSTAKSPVIGILITIFVYFIIRTYDLFITKFIAIFMAGVLAIFAVSGLTYSLNLRNSSTTLNSQVKSLSDPALELVVTPADLLRNRGFFFGHGVKSTFEYLTYRTILMPSEVASRWYSFYGESSFNSRSIANVITMRESPKASNLVGIWAYAERFPCCYAKFINANGSIDAEAFSFGGFLYVILFAILYLLLRLMCGIAYLSKDPFLVIIGISGLVHLSLMTYQAGFFAIFFAQGFFILPSLIIFSRQSK